MQYITAKQAAENWDLTVRRVQDLCHNHKIHGAVRWGRDWMIPTDAHRPEDRRRKTVEHKNHAIAQLPRKNPAILSPLPGFITCGLCLCWAMNTPWATGEHRMP